MTAILFVLTLLVGVTAVTGLTDYHVISFYEKYFKSMKCLLKPVRKERYE